jgi:prefoldin beta subunit
MSDTIQLPPSLQEKVTRLQQLQNTMQQLVIQKQRVDLEINETKRAIKILEDILDEAKVYRSSGAILVEKKKEDVEKELIERKEFLEMRSKVLEKQESKTRERLTNLQESIQKGLNLLSSGTG